MIVIRWSNGYWKHFDRDQYREVAWFHTLKEAERALGVK